MKQSLLFFFFLSVLQCYGQPDISRIITKGRSQFENGDYPSAFITLKPLENNTNCKQECQELVGVVKYCNDSYNEAIDFYTNRDTISLHKAIIRYKKINDRRKSFGINLDILIENKIKECESQIIMRRQSSSIKGILPESLQEPETPITTLPNKNFNYLPFGVSQFTNKQTGKGIFFAIIEGVPLVVGSGYLISAYSNLSKHKDNKYEDWERDRFHDKYEKQLNTSVWFFAGAGLMIALNYCDNFNWGRHKINDNISATVVPAPMFDRQGNPQMAMNVNINF